MKSNMFFPIQSQVFLLLVSLLLFTLSTDSDAVTVDKTITSADKSQPYLVAAKNPPDKVVALAIVTGYSSDEWQTDSTPHLTAHQTPVREGIAACPRKIPFHTKVVVLGQIYTCEDRMALKNDGKFDIWFPTSEKALKFGRQKIEVTILYDR